MKKILEDGKKWDEKQVGVLSFTDYMERTYKKSFNDIQTLMMLKWYSGKIDEKLEDELKAQQKRKQNRDYERYTS